MTADSSSRYAAAGTVRSGTPESPMEGDRHSGWIFGRDKLACIPYLVVISVSEPSHDLDAAFSANGREQDQRSVGAALNGSSLDVMAELGILEAREVANLLKLRTSTVLDLSRRGILPAFKIGKHWRYRRADLIEWIANRGEAG